MEKRLYLTVILNVLNNKFHYLSGKAFTFPLYFSLLIVFFACSKSPVQKHKESKPISRSYILSEYYDLLEMNFDFYLFDGRYGAIVFLSEEEGVVSKMGSLAKLDAIKKSILQELDREELSPFASNINPFSRKKLEPKMFIQKKTAINYVLENISYNTFFEIKKIKSRFSIEEITLKP